MFYICTTSSGDWRVSLPPNPNFVPAIEKKFWFWAKIKTMVNTLGNYFCAEKGRISDCRHPIPGGQHQNSCSLSAQLHWCLPDTLLTRATSASIGQEMQEGSQHMDWDHHCLFPHHHFCCYRCPPLEAPGRTGWKCFICFPLFVGFPRCWGHRGSGWSLSLR